MFFWGSTDSLMLAAWQKISCWSVCSWMNLCFLCFLQRKKHLSTLTSAEISMVTQEGLEPPTL